MKNQNDPKHNQISCVHSTKKKKINKTKPSFQLIKKKQKNADINLMLNKLVNWLIYIYMIDSYIKKLKQRLSFTLHSVD